MKYAKKVEEMIEEGHDWDRIEKSVEKLRRMDYKSFVKETFHAFVSNPKMFHANIQRIMSLKRFAKMDIKYFEDEEAGLIYEEKKIVGLIIDFYRNKFQDCGKKNKWCSEAEA